MHSTRILRSFTGLSCVAYGLMLALGLMLICSADLARAQTGLPYAQLTSVFPAGGKVGTTFDVTATGVDLEDATRLHFNHPGIKAGPKADAAPSNPSMGEISGKMSSMKRRKQVQQVFTVTVAPDVPTGLYDVRLVGKFGISNPRAFQLSDRAEFTKVAPTSSREKANVVSLETTINGRTENETADYYKFSAKQGQRVLIECATRRLDSRINNAKLLLLDAHERELAESTEGNRREAMIDYTNTADGDYYVKVHDLVFRGSNDHVYRVLLHTGPHVDFIFPNAGLPGSKGQYTIYGRNLPGGAASGIVGFDGKPLDQLKVNIELPSDPVVQRQLPITNPVEPQDSGLDGFAYRLNSPKGQSNSMLIGYSSAPVVLEQEPNDSPEQAQKLTVPCEVVGQFNPRGDQDWYQFEAKKGDVFWVEVISERLGLATDPYLLIQRGKKDAKSVEIWSDVSEVDDFKPAKPDGTVPVLADYDTSTNDPSYKLTVSEDGNFRVLVRDLYYGSRGKPQFVYRLAIRREAPDFRLIALADPPQDDRLNNTSRIWSPCVQKGGSAPLKVLALRRDEFKGDIELSIEGLPPGVHCQPVVAGPGLSVAAMVITADENAAPWAGSVKVIGKSKIGDTDVLREARGGSVVWGAANRQTETPRLRMTGDVALAVMNDDISALTIDAGAGKVWETSLGGKLQIPVKLTRRNDYKSNVQLTVPGVPAAIKPANLDIPGDKTEGTLNFEAKPGIPPGTYTFALHAATQVSNYRRDAGGAQVAAELSKEMEKMAADLAAAAKQATDNVTAANKAVADSQAVVKMTADKLKAAKAATQKTPQSVQLLHDEEAAAKELAQADDKLKAATDAKTAADAVAKEAAAKSKMAETEKAAAAQLAREAAEASKPKPINVVFVSTPVVVKIVPTPVVIEPMSAPGPLKRGQKIEVPVTVTRKYGFEEAVDLTLTPQPGVKAANVNIPKGQSQGKLTLEADAKAPLGDLTLALKAKLNFNGQQLAADQTLPLKLEAAEETK